MMRSTWYLTDNKIRRWVQRPKSSDQQVVVRHISFHPFLPVGINHEVDASSLKSLLNDHKPAVLLHIPSQLCSATSHSRRTLIGTMILSPSLAIDVQPATYRSPAALAPSGTHYYSHPIMPAPQVISTNSNTSSANSVVLLPVSRAKVSKQ